MLRLESVSKHYGSRTVVDDLSLEVADGEVCVIIGPSGCGKTTTLKMINRLIEPSSGRILLDCPQRDHALALAVERAQRGARALGRKQKHV